MYFLYYYKRFVIFIHEPLVFLFALYYICKQKNTNMIIGISGKKNAGKDCIGDMISQLDNSYKKIKYADKLKEITALLIGSTREDMEDRDFKETPLGEEWWIYSCTQNNKQFILPYKGTDKSYIENIEHELIKVSPRWLLQHIGTDCFREMIHPNTWVNATFSNYNPSQNLIVTDVRFINEADRIKELGGVVIRVNRKDTDDYTCTHRSEIELDDYQGFTYIINNDGDLQELTHKVKEIFDDINKQNGYV